MAINTVIIEDEEKSIYVLREFLRQLAPDMEVTGVAGHVEKAVRIIEEKAPQLVFLDIRIGNGLGFDVLKQLEKRDFELICITAYDSYALEAFRYSAIDYLLKPIGINELAEALLRVRQRLTERNTHNGIGALLHNLSGHPNKKISIPTAQGYEFVDLENIIWCRSDGSYTTLYLTDGSKLVSSRNIGYYEDLLCKGSFFRIHHNTIINLHWIKSYIKGKGGYVVMSNQVELEVSYRRKAEFLRRLMP
ncbi:LytR/AlgR family response regulator transcription factor [Puia dinghuensis]|uniref:DNA-binding response regulator n=1 Tax=Puia dinghuensis TaxID=1792502 RepID=A0A8J2UHT2_9BACT|nr:LytTR family DNA-binding domain-containing protein [Puia dinghuensis]GGB19359.1 DNA-binding response regulator [Puia dinghuensis]